jgi:1-acyl-sn-glycerol-3-phosphate acyltransferase
MTRYQFTKLVLTAAIKIIARVEIKGLENVPKHIPFILAVNHLSLLEPPVLFVIMPVKKITVLVGEKWAKHWLFNWILGSVNAIFVDRQALFDRRAVKAVLGALKSGLIVGMAPEGMRSRVGGMIRAKPGIAYLAYKADVPVLPVGISGQKDCLQKLKRLKRLCLRVHIGELIDPPLISEANKGEQFQQYADEIMVAIARLIDSDIRGVYASFVNCSNFEADEVSYVS